MDDRERVKKDNEEKKEYLRSYQRLLRELDDIQDQLTQTYYNFGLSSPGYDGMPHGSGGSGDLSERIIQLEKHEKRIRRKQTQCDKKMEEIVARIENLSDQTEREVLYYRYIKDQQWDDIAEKLHYSRQHINRIHGRALYHFRIWGK